MSNTRIVADENRRRRENGSEIAQRQLGRDRTRHLAHEAPVVLEIKFTDTYPFWVRRLVQRFQLIRLSMAKYVLCINELQREGGFFKLYENLE